MTAFRARSALLALAVGAVSLTAVAAATSASPPPALKNGGTLTIGLAEDPDALDPTLARTFVGRMVFMHMCEKLYDIELEARRSSRSSRRRCRSSRRTRRRSRSSCGRGLKFNDGTAFDAAAVKKSLDRHKTLARSTRASELSPVTSVDTQGEQHRRAAPRATGTRRSRRSSPTAPGWSCRRRRSTTSATSSRRTRSASGRSCSRSAQAGDHITLVKSPYYYGKKQGPPRHDRVQDHHRPRRRGRRTCARTTSTSRTAIPSTELQGIAHDSTLRVRQVDLDRLPGHHDQHREQERPQQGVREHRHGVRKSADLRQAFELALDRKLINRVVFGGTQQPELLPVPGRQPVLRRGAKGLPCHLTAKSTAAKAAFAASGASAPVDVHLMIGTDPIAARLGQVIQAAEKPIGFNVDPRADGVHDGAQPRRTPASSTRSRSAGRGASTRTATSTNSSTRRARRTTAATSNAVVDKATNQARAVLKLNRRDRLATTRRSCR